MWPEMDMDTDMSMEVVFYMTNNIQGWEAVRTNKEESLKESFREIIRDIESGGPHTTIIGLTGPSGTHKTTAGMGFLELLNNMQTLKKGVDLDVKVLPFPSMVMAAKYMGVIPKEEKHGFYSEESYKKISKFSWDWINSELRSDGKSHVIIVEASAPTAF